MSVSSADDGPVWTIVVAAGSGRRFGSPKQFLELAGVRVVDRSVLTAARHSDGVVVVVPAGAADDFEVAGTPAGVEVVAVEGAGSRAGSVRAGLAAVPDTAQVILVHDGARPLASDAVYERVIAAVRAGAEAVAPVVDIADTVRRRDGGVVDRDALAAVQTPQGFRAAAVRTAHAGAGDATDDVTLVERRGGTVVLVDGDRRNLKLTTPLDLEVAEVLLTSDADPETRP